MVDTKDVTSLEQAESQYFTKNGELTNATSLDTNVDLFFTVGSARSMSRDQIQNMFERAMNEEPEVAIRILLWARDVRGGAGERQVYRDLMEYVLNYLSDDEDRIRAFLNKTVEVGRWDDLLTVFFNTRFEQYALETIKRGLIDEKNGLCAKWMPRPKKSPEAKKIFTYLGMTPKQYRKLLVSLSNTVEQKMCANQWGQIEYPKVPSLATARYTNAFKRHDEDRFNDYIAKVNAGTEKINTGAVYPYDVVKNMRQGNGSAADAQWTNLPNYCEGNEGSVLAMVDTSGSMGRSVGDNPNLSVRDVAVSLGLYLSERLQGPFQNQFLTFSESPTLQTVRGNTLTERYDSLWRAKWDMNTDLQKAFNVLLEEAVRYNAPASVMPETILILSDMEFDAGGDGGSRWHQSVTGYGKTAMDRIEEKYAEAGYAMPNIVWWNLAARAGNVPVTHDKMGTALVSGFSPSIMKSLINAEDFTPRKIMLDTVMVDRYTV